MNRRSLVDGLARTPVVVQMEDNFHHQLHRRRRCHIAQPVDRKVIGGGTLNAHTYRVEKTSHIREGRRHHPLELWQVLEEEIPFISHMWSAPSRRSPRRKRSQCQRHIIRAHQSPVQSAVGHAMQWLSAALSADMPCTQTKG